MAKKIEFPNYILGTEDFFLPGSIDVLLHSKNETKEEKEIVNLIQILLG